MRTASGATEVSDGSEGAEGEASGGSVGCGGLALLAPQPMAQRQSNEDLLSTRLNNFSGSQHPGTRGELVLDNYGEGWWVGTIDLD